MNWRSSTKLGLMHYPGKLYALSIDRQAGCVALVRGKVGTVSYGTGPGMTVLVGQVVWDFTESQIFLVYRNPTRVEFYAADWHYNTVTKL